MSTAATPNPYFFTGKYGYTKYSVQLLRTEDPRQASHGGSWLMGIDRLFAAPLSYFCWMRGGHKFVEIEREYHYDSSETAHTYCEHCGWWVRF